MTTKTITRLPQAKQRTGLSCATIYALINADQFPPPISLGSRAVGWPDSDVDEFIVARVEAFRKA
ncbi:MAG: AlpA family transcriptional regulator [Pseudomonadota bacterium]